ncbi:MAG TPA: response regulator [Candidatus Binatia bacterium]|jgi:CheY-like chemotaxis protein|nr:response regulator [Candidatus Binatia bacterium]
MTLKDRGKALEILLVEDNPADVTLVQTALNESPIPYRLTVVTDGEEALAYLRQHGQYAQAVRPDLVLLDLDLPRKKGHEVLAELKQDEALQSIPVIILSTSQAATDIQRCYRLHANAYIVKPGDVEAFYHVIKQLEDFWFSIATLFAGEEVHWEGETVEAPTNGDPQSGDGNRK